jgi:AcrR family transcriptional regulator
VATGPASAAGLKAAGIPAPRPGRPRSERARQAILEAAGQLLQERGLRAMTAEEIAARAGVSKATIYRWWNAKEAVALDAFHEELTRLAGPMPDTGTLAGDLTEAMIGRIRLLATNPALGRTQAGLLALAQDDRGLRAEYLNRVAAPLRKQGREYFARAVARGEVAPEAPADVLLDLIFGALHHRVFQGHAPLDEDFARCSVKLVMSGLAGLGLTRPCSPEDAGPTR